MPSFARKSAICKAAMLSFSEGLSHYSCAQWMPQPFAEAPEKLAKIVHNAAISRVRPIAHSPNQWEMHRSSAGTVGSPNAGSPMVGTDLGAGTGSMDTCVAQGHPS
jgi:hypothetical protein